MFERYANTSLDAQYKRPPGSTFSQADLDTFNKRQDEYRRTLSSLRGPEALKDVNRYERVEDIPQYTEEEYRQYINDWSDQRKAARGPKYNVPDNPAYGEGPMNKRLTQEFKDGLASLTDKYKNRSVTREDIQNFQNIQIAEDIPNSSENVARNAQNAGATQAQNNSAQSFQQQRADSQDSGTRESAGYAQMASNVANISSSNRGGNGQMTSNAANASGSNRAANSQVAANLAIAGNSSGRNKTNADYQSVNSQNASNAANASRGGSNADRSMRSSNADRPRRNRNADRSRRSSTANASRGSNTNTEYQSENSRKKRKRAKERAQGWKQRWKSRRNKKTSDQTSANKPTNADDTTPQKFGKEGAVVNRDRSPQ